MNELPKNLSNYFALRGVTDFSAENYVLPPFFLTSLPADKNINICDLGCGFGRLMTGLKNIGYKNVYGIDQETEAIDWCKKEGLSADFISIKDFVLKEVTNRFDLVIMSHVLEHVPKEDIISTLISIKENILKPGGTIYIIVPNAQSTTGCYWAYEDFTHSTLFTAGSLLYVLKAAGFEEVTLVDPQCLAGLSKPRIYVRKFLLNIYRLKNTFWNKVTASSFHKPSPEVYSFELKMKAK